MPSRAKPKPPQFSRRIKLGLIGCGGRGPWLAELFRRHGGYELHAVADYFDASAQQAGDRLGVDKNAASRVSRDTNASWTAASKPWPS